jgi:hypothetical protein
MWRDEIQLWLISRDSPSPLGIFQNLRYTGHPPLWNLLLWPLTRLTRNPAAMQGLNVLVAACAVFLIAKAAPVSRWLRAAAVLGYFPVYEYGSIAYNNALGFVALVAFCAVFPRRRQHPFLVGVLLFFAAYARFHALLLALAMLVALAAELVVKPPEQQHRTAAWVGLGIAACGITLSILQMRPPPDSGYVPDWFFGFDASRAQEILAKVASAYLPLPIPGSNFWNSEILRSLPIFAAYAWLGGAVVLVLVSFALVRRPLALIYYLVGSLGLLAFFYTKYAGHLAHHGFLFICFGTALWVAGATQPLTLPRPIDLLGRWAERAVTVLFPLLLAAHMVGAGIAAAADYQYVFSGAKATAEMIRERGLDRLPLVGDSDVRAAGVVGYLDKDRAYYPAGRRFGSYIVFDQARLLHYDVWKEAGRLSTLLNSRVVVAVDFATLKETPPPPEWLRQPHPRLRLEGYRQGEVVKTESYCVFLLESGPVLP